MMGSRANRARRGLPQPVKAVEKILPAANSPMPNPPIPELTRIDVVFGNIEHMPAYASVPESFKESNNPYVEFISRWFFGGLKQEDLDRLKPRPGVEKVTALTAIRAILGSFEPKHEHKEAGCAYLLSCWFELNPL